MTTTKERNEIIQRHQSGELLSRIDLQKLSEYYSSASKIDFGEPNDRL